MSCVRVYHIIEKEEVVCHKLHNQLKTILRNKDNSYMAVFKFEERDDGMIFTIIGDEKVLSQLDEIFEALKLVGLNVTIVSNKMV